MEINDLVQKKRIIKRKIIGNKDTKENWKLKIAKLFLLCFAFVLYIEVKKVLYIEGFQFFNFWTVEIILILHFMRKYFIMDFYKHHKISIIFIILICSGLLLAASFIPNTAFGENSGNAYQNIKTQLGSYFYSILFIFIFIILSYIYAFSRVYSKILMQIKFISPYKIILTIGIIGFIISILASIVSYFIEYRDNFYNYFSAMKEVLKGEKKYKFWVEIFCVYPLYSFVCFMDITFEIFIIYYLNPFYVLLANNLYYGVAEIISFLLYLSNNSFRITQYVIAQSSEVFVSLGNMVYLEIV